MNLIRRIFSPPSGEQTKSLPETKPIESIPASEDKPADKAPVVEITPPAVTPDASRINTAILMDGVTRPLSPDSLPAYVGTAHLSVGQVSDVGKIRSNSQDAASSFFTTSRTSEERPD